MPDRRTDLRKAFDAKAHPRWPKGTPGIGGQFCPKFVPEADFNVATNVFRALDPKNPRTKVLARRFNEAAKKEDWKSMSPAQSKKTMQRLLRNTVVAHLRTDDPLEAGRSVPREQKGKANPGTKKNPIDVGGDVEKAALYLSLGKHVKLDQPDEVSTLIEKLGDYVNRTTAAGGDVPNLDLCKVSVKGTNIFCVKSKGIPRIKMPQLTGEPTKGSKADRLLKPGPRGETDLTPEFLKFLKKVEKVKVKHENLRADHLRASQNQLNAKTVALLKSVLDRGEALTPDLPIVVSRDNYIVDGHHRWAAKVANDLNDNHPGDVKMDVFKIDMSITELLFLANSFAADWGIPQRSVAQNVTKHVLAAVHGEKVEKFNPFQLRDWRGRWSKAGAAVGIAAAGGGLALAAEHAGGMGPHTGDEEAAFVPGHPDFIGHAALQPTEAVAKPHAVQQDARLPHLEQRGDKLVYVVPYGTKVGAVKKAFLRAIHGRDLSFEDLNPNEPVEKKFDPNQRRGPDGRWIKGFAATFYKPENFAEHYWTGRLSSAAMRERDRLDRMTAPEFNLPEKIKIDPDIKRIRTADDAEKFFREKLGVPADGFVDFQASIAEQGGSDEEASRFYQEIAQATRDAQKKFPILKKKSNGLGGIVSVAEEKRRTDAEVPGGSEDDFWAMTGPEWGVYTGDETWGQRKMIAMTKPTVKINENAEGFHRDDDEAAQLSLIALSDMTPYGRLTHELGHAVAYLSGMEFYDLTESFGDNENLDTLIGLFRQVFKAEELADMSQYGAGDAGEMLAELFSILHTPGGMDTLNPGQKRQVLKFRDLINNFAKEHPDKVKGPIL